MEYFGDRSLDNRIRIKDKPEQTCFNQRGGLNGCAPPRREDVGEVESRAARSDSLLILTAIKCCETPVRFRPSSR